MAQAELSDHGIKWFSPSTVNSFITQPALCLLKIAGISDQAGPGAWRGIGIDVALTEAAFDHDLSRAAIMRTAYTEFDKAHAKSEGNINSDKLHKERDSMEKYIDVGLGFVRSHGIPLEAQTRIQVQMPGLDVPMIGYFDLLYEKDVRDIKTSARAVNAPTDAACRQVAIYHAATGRRPWLDYITPKNVFSYPIDDAADWLENLRCAALSLQTLLKTSNDILDVCRMVYPDTSHWMWSDTMRLAAKDVWK